MIIETDNGYIEGTCKSYKEVIEYMTHHIIQEDLKEIGIDSLEDAYIEIYHITKTSLRDEAWKIIIDRK